MTKEEFNRLPMMLGMRHVEDCIGIKRATIYRALEAGRMKHPVKIGGANRWSKAYIEQVMEKGFDPAGTYPPYSERTSAKPVEPTPRSGPEARA